MAKSRTTTITGAADNALFCNDSRGLMITANIIAKSGNGGIRVWQSDKRRDGSLIADNRIEDTRARAGGTGQNGNAINVFRASDVIVRGNHIRNAAFSAIRGNSASNIQIIGNNCAALDEVAIYSEFGFEGAVIADNVVDGAETGISVTNFNEGGRLATVRGNIVRNLGTRRPNRPPDEAGIGIGVEADTAVTGNVIERAARAGISAGWGQYLRNVAITGNVVREAGFGVAVSVAAGAGIAVISGNVFAGTKRGAIVGMEWDKAVTGDLALAGAERYPQLADQRQSGELTAATAATFRPECLPICNAYDALPAPPAESSSCSRSLLYFSCPSLARAALYAIGNDPRSWRDADWSSTGALPPAADLPAGARGRLHRHHRRLEGHFLGA